MITFGSNMKTHNDVFNEIKRISKGNNTPVKFVRFRPVRAYNAHEYNNPARDVKVDEGRYLLLQEMQKMGFVQEKTKSKSMHEDLFPPSYELTYLGEALLNTLD